MARVVFNTGGQFHQHFLSSFCADILLTKNYKAKQTASREKLHITLLYEKSAYKILVNV
jgi:hypothetical protein